MLEMETEGGPCEICGAIGWDKFILTCSRCRTRKHQYCTEIPLLEPPDDWICEDCHPNNEGSPSIPYEQKDLIGVDDTNRGLDTSKRLNSMKTVKVKFLPIEDVLKLSPGQPQGNDNRLAGQTNKGKSLLKGKEKIYPVREPKQRVTAKKSIESNLAMIGEAPVAKKAENKNIVPSASIVPGGELCNVTSDKDTPMENDASLLDSISRAAIYHPHFPSKLVTWKGRFKFPADTTVDSHSDIFYKAIPPMRVSRKAFERSLKLPIDLQVDLIPLDQLLPDLFHDFEPDLRDTGVYFAAEDASDRAFKEHESLVKCLLLKRSAIRCGLDGAELFIFSSNILNADSQRYVVSGLKTKYFLWGLYHSTRSKRDPSNAWKEISAKNGLDRGECKNLIKEHASNDDINPGDVGFTLSQQAKFNAHASTSHEPVCIADSNYRGTSPLNGFKEVEQSGTANISNVESQDERAECIADSKTVELKKTGSIGTPSLLKRAIESCDVVPTEKSGKIIKAEGQVLPPEAKPLVVPGRSGKNWVKLNTSSVWRSDKGTAGAGGIICSSSGKWLLGFILNLGKCGRLRADLWSLFQGLKLLWDREYRAVHVNTGFPQTLSLVKKAPASGDPNGDLIQGCRDLLLRDWKYNFNEVKLEDNGMAHGLADLFESYDLGLTLLEAPLPELTPLLKGNNW